MAVYTRNTELRHLQHKDLYELSMILDYKDGWIKLMEIIPKGINNQDLHSDSLDRALALNGRKYSYYQVVHTADAGKSMGQLKSQILLEEWGISGRKHERPTLGLLLLLLIKVELFCAADFISINLLKESPQKRPNQGLAASINTSLPSEIFGEIEQMVNECEAYPSTGELNRSEKNVLDNNKDYCAKRYELTKKQILTNKNSSLTSGVINSHHQDDISECVPRLSVLLNSRSSTNESDDFPDDKRFPKTGHVENYNGNALHNASASVINNHIEYNNDDVPRLSALLSNSTLVHSD